MVILLIIYFKRKEGNQRTILMRIMANYSQVMATTLTYNLDFPKVLTNVFSPFEQLGSGSKTVFSMD